MPATAAMIVLVVPPYVRHSHPAQPSPQGLVRPGPKHQVPVIRQDAVGQQLDRISGESFRQHALEGLVISGLMKQSQPSVPTIENV